MSSDLINGIVRILHLSGASAGTGFLVSADGLIVTCAHVVESAQSGNEVAIIFHCTGEKRTARVVPESWRGPDAEDVAFLRVQGPLPDTAKPLPIGSSQGTTGHEFKTLGFPEAKSTEGLWGYGSIGDATKQNGFKVLQLTDAAEITRGFSGAPVWDDRTRRVVGIISAVTAPDRYGRLTETAFITPTETLTTISPDLQTSEVCPYKSLYPFTEADAEFFFGRQRLADRLLISLQHEPRFLAVLGPSGSGKSSLVQAGLIPVLRQGHVPKSDAWHIAIIAHLGERPFDVLANAGLPGAEQGLPESVAAWLERHPEHTRYVLVLDQFEEILVVCPEEERERLEKQLLRLLDSSLPVTLVLTLRDDFYSRLAQQLPGLLPWLERALVNVPPSLEDRELMEIITGPAGIVGLRFEPGLADTIVRDALESAVDAEAGRVGRSTILPLLEFTLTQLWEHRQDGMLTHAAYGLMGGVTGSLSQWADRAYYALDDQGRQMAHRILIDLIFLGDESQGLPDSRRRRQLSELIHDETEQSRVHRIVTHLSDARLLVTGRAAPDQSETVEIIHDALLREWGFLQKWLADDRRFLSWRQATEARARAWQATSPLNVSQRDEGRLLRGQDLPESEKWLAERRTDLGALEQDFVTASLVLREKEHLARERLRQRITLGLAIGLILTIGLALLAWGQRNTALEAQATSVAESNARATAVVNAQLEANRRATAQADAEARRQEAEEQRQLAVARGLAVQAQLLQSTTGDLTSATLLAVESLTRTGNTDAGVLLQRILDQLPILQARLDVAAPVAQATFSQDSRWLVVLTRDKAVQVWDWASRQIVYRLDSSAPTTGLIVNSDGHALITLADDGVRLWNLTTGQLLRYIAFAQPNSLQQFSPDGRWLAAVQPSDASTVSVWDLAEVKPPASISLTGSTSAIVFSPDSQWLGIGSSAGDLQIWNVISGTVTVHSTKQTPASIKLIAFSPNSQWIASATGDDGNVDIQEIATGHSVASIQYDFRIDSFKFTPDSQRLIVARSGGTSNIALGTSSGAIEKMIGLWSTRSWREYAEAIAPLDNIFEIHPAGRVVASGQNEWVYIWDTTSGDTLGQFDVRENVNQVIWDPGEYPNWFATISGGNCTKERCTHALQIWSLPAGQLLAQFATPNSNNRQFTISADKKFVAGWDYDGTDLDVWELHPIEAVSPNPVGIRDGIPPVDRLAFSADGKQLIAFRGDEAMTWQVPAGGVEAGRWVQANQVPISRDRVAYDPQLMRLVSIDQSAALVVWDLRTGEAQATFTPTAESKSVALSLDGQFVAAGEVNGLTQVWDVTTGKQAAHVTQTGAVANLAFSPDSQLVAASSISGTVLVFSSKIGNVIANTTFTDTLERSLFSHTGQRVVSVGARTVTAWDVTTGRSVCRIDHTDVIGDVALSPDDQLLLSGGWDKAVKVCNLATGKLAAMFEVADLVTSAEFSPDGQLFLVSDNSGAIHIWDTATFHEKYKIQRVGAIRAHFSPSGRWILSVGFDNKTLVFDVKTGQLVSEVWLPSGLAWTAEFSPDEKRIAVYGANSGTLRLTMWQPNDLITATCSRVTRNLAAWEWQQYLPPNEPYRKTCPNLP